MKTWWIWLIVGLIILALVGWLIYRGWSDPCYFREKSTDCLLARLDHPLAINQKNPGAKINAQQKDLAKSWQKFIEANQPIMQAQVYSSCKEASTDKQLFDAVFASNAAAQGIPLTAAIITLQMLGQQTCQYLSLAK